MTDIALNQLHHHPDNPPARLDDIDELADSIRAAGILQPLLIEPSLNGGYLVIAGNRRLAAAARAGLNTVPCTIREPHDSDNHTEVRLIENGHRRNLSPLEQARAFGRLRGTGLTQAEIAKRTGFSVGHVSGRLTLLELDEATQARVDSGQVSVDHAVNAVRAVRNHTRRAAKAQRRKSAQEPTPVPPTAGQVSVGESGSLDWSNPVAEAANTRCKTRHGLTGGLIGRVACGACWEHAIRADERWLVEEGPTPEVGPVLDEIAIQRAIAGQAVRLTPAERREVAQRAEAARQLRNRSVTAAVTA